MPQFFNLDNNKQPKHMVKNIAEVNAYGSIYMINLKSIDPTRSILVVIQKKEKSLFMKSVVYPATA